MEIDTVWKYVSGIAQFKVGQNSINFTYKNKHYQQGRDVRGSCHPHWDETELFSGYDISGKERVTRLKTLQFLVN